jgi:hypothetical protein
LLPKKEELMGKMVSVEIVSASKFSMVGRVIDGSVQRPTDFEPLKVGQVSGVSEVFRKDLTRENSTYLIFKWSFVICLFALGFRLIQFVL